MADSVKIKITGDASEFQNTLSGIKGTAGSMFKGIMASQIVTKGISLLTGELKNAITTGMQFEAAMSQVAAISGATGSELELLTETAKHYGETTMFSASQAAEALNYMALAGWDANQSVDALGGVLDLAAASGMDLGAASDAVTDYLSAFSMEASQAGYMADMMAYAQSKSNTTASMLADAYGNCASSMHAAGQDIETTTAMLMALANQGIKGSEAGTQMAAVMRDLTQKMDDGQIMIGKTAVQVADAQGNFRDLNDIIIDVGKATEGMGTAEQSAAIMTTFTARSVKAIQTLLNEGMDNVNAYEDALRGSEGTAAEQARIMMDNLQGDIKLYQSALEGVRITASESLNDSARGIVQEGTAVLDAMNQAGKTQGIGGMFDAAIAQIPRLLPKAVKGVEGLLAGVGKRLPGLVKNLISTIPDVLGGMGDIAPMLIESLSEAVSAAIDGVISNLPQIATSLAEGLGKALIASLKGVGNIGQTLVDSVFGVKGATDYESFGNLTGELTYAVDTSAEVDNTGAEADITAAWNDFIGTLKEYGLTTEQVAQVLAFKGTQEELDSWLMTNFPDLDEAARKAIKSKFTATGDGKSLADLFGEGETLGLTAEDLAGIIVNTDLTAESIESYLTENFPDLDTAAKNAIASALGKNNGIGASLVSQLQGMGIKPSDIVTILTSQAEGDTGTIESLLEEKYANIKQDAITALTNAWNNSPAQFDTSGASLGFAAGLIVDMFTNGKTEDAASIDAALETAKGIIDKKRQELIEYIQNGGEDQGGAENALNLLDQYDQALTDYATNYANASTAICQEAGAGLMDLAQQCQDAVNSITASTQQLISLEENLFNRGKSGTKLTDADTYSAMNFIAYKYQSAKADAEKAREDAIAAGADYEQAETAYQAAISKAMAQSRQDIADLLRGQAGDIEGLDVGAAISSIWGQMIESANVNGTLIESQVEQMLRDAGFNDDLIGRALTQVFGEQTYTGSIGAGDLAGHDFGDEVNSFLADYLSSGDKVDAATIAEIMKGSGFGSDVISQVIGELFTPEDMTIDADQLNLEQIIGSLDFGSLGSIIKTAVENGLIEGVDSTEGLDINQLILSLISESYRQPTPAETSAEAEVDVDVKPGDVTADEGTADKVTQAVEEAAEGSNATANPALNVDPEVQPAEGTAQKVSEATEQALEGTESAAAQTVEATADVNMTIGNVTVSNGSGIGSMIAQQLSGQAANVQVDINANVGSVKLNGGAAVNTAARQLVSNAIRAAQAQTASAASVGRNLSSGLASGILAGRGAVVAAARSVAQAAANAMRSAMQIHSPSKVTEGFGRMFDQGLVVGIDKGTKDVVSSAVAMSRRVAGAANLTPRTDVSGLSASMGSAMNDFAEAESSRQYVFRVNGRDLAVATSRDYGTELNGFAKSISMGYGRG